LSASPIPAEEVSGEGLAKMGGNPHTPGPTRVPRIGVALKGGRIGGSPTRFKPGEGLKHPHSGSFCCQG